MKRYIPLDFFEKNRTNMYGTKARCIKEHGSFFEFEEGSISLDVAAFNEDKTALVLCPIKKAARDAAEADFEKGEWLRNRVDWYIKNDARKDEAVVEKLQGNDTKWNLYIAEREAMKVENPK